jgi:hypothetical protein
MHCRFEEIALAFNGGKDSVVLLHLIYLVLNSLHKSKYAISLTNHTALNNNNNKDFYQEKLNNKTDSEVHQLCFSSPNNQQIVYPSSAFRLRTIYFQLENSFLEVTEFVNQAAKMYSFSLSLSFIFIIMMNMFSSEPSQKRCFSFADIISMLSFCKHLSKRVLNN